MGLALSNEAKGGILALLGLELLVAALFPVARALDQQTARTAEGIDAIQQMADAQFSLVEKRGRPEPMTVAPGKTVRVGDVVVSTSGNMSVHVDTTEDGYCVSARNVRDDVDFAPRCWTNSQDPSLQWGVLA